MCSKVWLCTSGADRYLKSHTGLYRQLLSRSRSEHLIELINTGKLSVQVIIYLHHTCTCGLVNSGDFMLLAFWLSINIRTVGH